MSIEDTLEAITKQLENHEKRISKLEARPQTENESTNTNKKISIVSAPAL
jgi:predicted component of type VI protein secretion system